MKPKLTALSQRYVAALKEHLEGGLRSNSDRALGLGRQAVGLGLETLDMAKIHQQALATLEASSSRNGIIKRAELFFRETIAPIETIHGAALKSEVRLSKLNKTLGRRTIDLAASNHSLKRGIAQRKGAEKALKKSVGDSKMLLKESRRLQKHLQHLAHQILATQEKNRRKISLDLKDEIGQTLLGINVRLLTVKRAADLKDQGLQKEITITQRLVNMSAREIERLARECRKPEER